MLAKPREAVRVNAATKESLQAFFDMFESITARLRIEHADVWNIDETRLALRVCSN